METNPEDRTRTTAALAEDEKNVTDDPNEVKRIRLDHAQCVLSSLMGTHLRGLISNPRTRKSNLYKNLILLDSSKPGEMVSAINKTEEAEEFFGIHA